MRRMGSNNRRPIDVTLLQMFEQQPLEMRMQVRLGLFDGEQHMHDLRTL